MDIVVKLPDKDYSVMLTKIMLACHGCKIIELPKGHGDLKDVSNFITITDIRADGSEYTYVSYDEIESASTIIEADRSEGE